MTNPLDILSHTLVDACAHTALGNLWTNDVHLWVARTDHAHEYSYLFSPILSSDERHRAERYKSPEEAAQFIITRGILRTILSHYAGVNPDQLTFQYTLYGKPYLEPEPDAPQIHFNVSHSHACTLYAITQDRQVGIDLEYDRELPYLDQLVARYFSPREQQQWKQLAPDHQRSAAIRGWTRKEAYIKAVGLGFAHSINDIEIAFLPDSPASGHLIESPGYGASSWYVFSLDVIPGYHATLVVEAS
jgi:4'-phosphopantetheinyl transferase